MQYEEHQNPPSEWKNYSLAVFFCFLFYFVLNMHDILKLARTQRRAFCPLAVIPKCMMVSKRSKFCFHCNNYTRLHSPILTESAVTRAYWRILGSSSRNNSLKYHHC